MAFASSLDKPKALERECREKPNFADFPVSIRIIGRLAEFALRDFRFCENHEEAVPDVDTSPALLYNPSASASAVGIAEAVVCR